MLDPQLIAFFFVAGAITLSPGADTMLVIRNVLRGGRRDGLITSVGVCSGLTIHASLSAVGVSIILAQSAVAFQAVKILGAIYLVWLGVKSLRSAMMADGVEPTAALSSVATVLSPRRSFLEGLLTNALNPKVAVFYLAFLPQFIRPDDPVLARSFLLASIHITQGLLWLGVLSFMLDKGRSFITRPRVKRTLDATCGTVLLGLGLKLAIEKTP